MIPKSTAQIELIEPFISIKRKYKDKVYILI